MSVNSLFARARAFAFTLAFTASAVLAPSFAAATMMEKVDLGKMLPIFLPWLLPRLAVVLVLLGGAAWGLTQLL